MTNFLSYHNYFLMGIKGVGMTALASCLKDAGKRVTGSDTAERFPTSKNLERMAIVIQDFSQKLPKNTNVVVYTGSHGGATNPLVTQAIEQNIPVFSHMDALSQLFNDKKGVAVCGVGGKSSISAMISFVCEKIKPQSYAVGVGEIIGLPKTGQYIQDSDYFIAEADEYVADPTTIGTPAMKIRMLYLQPQIIICPNLRFDHPDVYRDFQHTKEIFSQFFHQIKENGTLIYNGDDTHLRLLAKKLEQDRPDVSIISYGKKDYNIYNLKKEKIELNVPGEFNRLNALAALIACKEMGYEETTIRQALLEYRSVLRRMEYLGDNAQGTAIWDDYAHHPSEIKASIAAIKEKYKKTGKNIIVAFQPHTFSRTKQLFREFMEALATAPEVWLVDIFPSAREKFDRSISSGMLAVQLNEYKPDLTVYHVGSVNDLRERITERLDEDDVLLILGAGDIYHAVRDD